MDEFKRALLKPVQSPHFIAKKEGTFLSSTPADVTLKEVL